MNRELHRDLGYISVGLTIVFAVSGIALNHIADWNPNYRIDKQVFQVTEIPVNRDDEVLKQLIVRHLTIDLPVIAHYWQAEDVYKVFFEGGSHAALTLDSGVLLYESVRVRPVLRRFNALHLNELKGSWIAFSDLYAGALLFLSFSGLLMVKGRYGPLRVRGISLLAAGAAIPLFYMFYV